MDDFVTYFSISLQHVLYARLLETCFTHNHVTKHVYKTLQVFIFVCVMRMITNV